MRSAVLKKLLASHPFDVPTAQPERRRRGMLIISCRRSTAHTRLSGVARLGCSSWCHLLSLNTTMPANKSEANGRSTVPAKMDSKKKDTVWSNPLRFDLSWLSPIEV